MANLSIRKLDTKIFQRLKLRAVRHGRSMEEEARQILGQAVGAPENLGDLALDFFGKKYGVELQLSRAEPHEPIQLQ